MHHLLDGRLSRVTQTVHAHHSGLEIVEIRHRDALHEALPFLHVLGLVQLGQGLANLLRAAFQAEVIAGCDFQYPVGALQLFGGGFFEGFLDVAVPGFAGEGTRNGIAARNHFTIQVANNADNGHLRKPR